MSTKFIIDIETTGIDPQSGRMLSVGGVAVNKHWEVISEFEEDIFCPRVDLEFMCNKKVIAMHTKSGLWDRVQTALPIDEVEEHLANWITASAQGEKKLILVNNNVHFDRAWISQHMPRVNKLFHYRMIDVSGINELVKLYRPEIAARIATNKQYGHTGLADAHETLGELKVYIDEIFKGV